jgi:hypothetical protein
MIAFGPVAEAAQGGHNSPAFDLVAGFGLLALTWWGSWKRPRRRAELWSAIGITAICGVFIYFGFVEILR